MKKIKTSFLLFIFFVFFFNIWLFLGNDWGWLLVVCVPVYL